MQLGSENYQLKDSYFVVIHPNTYVIIGISVLIILIAFIILKKRKRRNIKDWLLTLVIQL